MTPHAYRFFFGLLCAFCLLATDSIAQQARPQLEFLQRFRTFHAELPREHLALHTDRPWYFAGDRIWFSAYATAGPAHQPSPVSKLLYVELYGPEGDMLERINMKLTDGRGSGSIALEQARDAGQGTYEIRAYTAWGLNFGEAYAFRRSIPVYQPGAGIAASEAPEARAVDLQLLPEGGELVAGLETRIGFKATGADGQARAVRGHVKNERGEAVAEFETAHEGMGYFMMTPAEDITYVAVIEQDDGIQVPADTLRPISEGVAMRIDPTDSQFNIRAVSSSEAVPQPLMIFGHVRGEVYYAAGLQPFEEAHLAWAPRAVFPPGVVHFTLLDGEGRPVAERLAYNAGDAAQELQLTFRDGDEVRPREQAALDVGLPDDEEEAFFSISIYDDELAAHDASAPNLQTELLLQSGLRGHIASPAYYFGDDEQAGEHLDLLLMTQGWRAYDMQGLYESRDVELRFMPEKGFKVSGTLTSLVRRRPLEEAVVNFSIGEGNEQSFLASTNAEGRFLIDGLDIEGNVPVLLRANREDGSDRIRINLDEQFAHLPRPGHDEEPLRFGPLPVHHLPDLDETDRSDSQERIISAQNVIENFVDTQMQVYLDAVTVTAERAPEGDVFQRQQREMAASSQRLDLDARPELENLPVIVMLGQIPGVRAVSNASGGESLVVSTGASSISGSAPPPLIIIDGINTDLEVLQTLQTSDIQSVDVYRRAAELAAFGASGTGGAIRIQTRTGVNIQGSQRGRLTAMVEGYQLPTRFYTPRYGFNIAADAEQADERITLHWNPSAEIRQGDNGEGRFFFWANDIPGRYRVQVEGITASGSVFSESRTLEIRP